MGYRCIENPFYKQAIYYKGSKMFSEYGDCEDPIRTIHSSTFTS